MKILVQVAANKHCQDIVLEIWCDDVILGTTGATTNPLTVVHDLPDHAGQHQIKLVMHGKNYQHTKLDAQDNILDDVYFLIEKLEFEEIDLRDVFCQGRPCFTHSFNGSKPEFVDEFYGHIGCNGTVNLEFTTPIYLWLGEFLD